MEGVLAESRLIPESRHLTHLNLRTARIAICMLSYYITHNNADKSTANDCNANFALAQGVKMGMAHFKLNLNTFRAGAEPTLDVKVCLQL